MQPAHRTHVLLMDHAGFPDLTQQRALCGALPNSGPAEHVLTQADPRSWQHAVLTFFGTLQDDDEVLAESLSILAPTLPDLLDNLLALSQQGATFTSRTEGFHSREGTGAMPLLELIRTAQETSQDRQAAAELAAPTSSRGVTPPHARAIALSSFERLAR